MAGFALPPRRSIRVAASGSAREAAAASARQRDEWGFLVNHETESSVLSLGADKRRFRIKCETEAKGDCGVLSLAALVADVRVRTLRDAQIPEADVRVRTAVFLRDALPADAQILAAVQFAGREHGWDVGDWTEYVDRAIAAKGQWWGPLELAWAGLACGVRVRLFTLDGTAAADAGVPTDGSLADVLAQYGCRAHAKQMRFFRDEANLLLCNASHPLTRTGHAALNHYVPLSPLDPAPGLTKKRRCRVRQRDHKCDVCGTSFHQSSHLKEHVRSHGEGSSTHKCSECDANFTRKRNLCRHQRDCHKAEPGRPQNYPCTWPSCAELFSYPSALAQHLRQQHLASPPSFRCGDCNKAFCRASNLKRHERKHRDEPDKHRCGRCGKILSRLDALARHAKRCKAAAPGVGASSLP